MIFRSMFIGCSGQHVKKDSEADFLQGKSWKSIQKFVINNLQRPSYHIQWFNLTDIFTLLTSRFSIWFLLSLFFIWFRKYVNHTCGSLVRWRLDGVILFSEVNINIIPQFLTAPWMNTCCKCSWGLMNVQNRFQHRRWWQTCAGEAERTQTNMKE